MIDTTEKTYWSRTGRHQHLADSLNELIPMFGTIAGEANAKLEYFRRASNAYYDIFNNGGWNERGAIRRIFGFPMSQYLSSLQGGGYDWDAIHEIVEPIMDDIIHAAAVEQGLHD